jgi:hypothetical protein
MSLLKEVEQFFPNTKAYGPYISKQDGRSRITFREIRSDGLLIKGGRSFTMSLARAKMTVKEQRILDNHEEVDHRDEDKTNDSDSNLQILNTQTHCNKTIGEIFVKRNEKPLVSCPNCLSDFFCSVDQIKVAESKGRQPCCSRYCSSALYARNQNMVTSVSGR